MSPHDHSEDFDGNINVHVLNERVKNFMDQSESDRADLRVQVNTLRNQTHDWMQAMLNRLPPWAVAVGSAMWTVLGAMSMWILQHLK
jgi:hypothetical protein